VITRLTLTTHPEYLELLNPRAVDGDTIIADVKLPLGITITRRIRLKGFFAPEHKGANPTAADAATQRLQNALQVHTCHIACHGMREDRYGRLTATLLLNGRAVHPGAVLGELQLSPEAHRADLNVSRAGGQSDRRL
jgi:hypothetical protein